MAERIFVRPCAIDRFQLIFTKFNGFLEFIIISHAYWISTEQTHRRHYG